LLWIGSTSSGTHALVVIGAFAIAFAAIAVFRTVRPDVLE
jgi:hypothetical protein